MKKLRLRRLSINGAGSGTHGIRVVAANTVAIEDTVIDGFSGNGLNVETTNTAQVFVKHATISNNVGAGVNVVAGKSQVGIFDVSVVFNGTGLNAPAGSIILFNNNVIYGNKKGDPVAAR